MVTSVDPVETNIVIFEIASGLTAAEFVRPPLRMAYTASLSAPSGCAWSSTEI